MFDKIFYSQSKFLYLLIIYTCISIIGCEPPENSEKIIYKTQVSESEDSNNNQPVANAGDDQSILITESSNVILNGSQSNDPDGDELNYLWTSVDSDILVNTSQSVTSLVKLPAPGEYHFVLIVDDDNTYSNPDIVKITVVEPDAYANSLLTVESGINYKTIQGAIDSVADDGTPKIIIVQNGPFKEVVNVKPNIHLIGVVKDNIMPRIETSSDDTIVNLNKNSIIEKIRVANLNDQISTCKDLTQSAIKVCDQGAEIINCVIQESYCDGIFAVSNSSANIKNCTIYSVKGEGIQAENNVKLEVEDSKFIRTSGSAIWCRYNDSVVIKNSIIYNVGWNGIDLLECEEAHINHCAIIDFGFSPPENTTNIQTGIKISGGGTPINITSNLIIIPEKSLPCGVEFNSYTNKTPRPLYQYNYIFSKQEEKKYYYREFDTYPDGNYPDETNYPNIIHTETPDPLIISPEENNFQLDENSPARGKGENQSNPGAEGQILYPSNQKKYIDSKRQI